MDISKSILLPPSHFRKRVFYSWVFIDLVILALSYFIVPPPPKLWIFVVEKHWSCKGKNTVFGTALVCLHFQVKLVCGNSTFLNEEVYYNSEVRLVFGNVFFIIKFDQLFKKWKCLFSLKYSLQAVYLVFITIIQFVCYLMFIYSCLFIYLFIYYWRSQDGRFYFEIRSYALLL